MRLQVQLSSCFFSNFSLPMCSQLSLYFSMKPILSTKTYHIGCVCVLFPGLLILSRLLYYSIKLLFSTIFVYFPFVPFFIFSFFIAISNISSICIIFSLLLSSIRAFLPSFCIISCCPQLFSFLSSFL